MRLFSPALPAAVLITVLSSLAHADTYMFNFTGINPEISDATTYTVNFEVDSTPVPGSTATTPDDFFFTLQPSSCDNNVGVVCTYLNFDKSGAVFAYDLGLPSGEELTIGPGFLSGTAENPVFTSGTYAAAVDGSDFSLSPQGTVEITDESRGVAVTPEPSTLVTLSTGLLGAAGAIRRRLSRA